MPRSKDPVRRGKQLENLRRRAPGSTSEGRPKPLRDLVVRVRLSCRMSAGPRTSTRSGPRAADALGAPSVKLIRRGRESIRTDEDTIT
jgi:hypothetical protein